MNKERAIKKTRILFLAALINVLAVMCVSAQTSDFTYQGKLTDTGVSGNGLYDFTFKLYDSLTNGTQIGSDVVVGDLPVSNGIFTADLDFGTAALTGGAPRFLEISVRAGASTGAYTILAPRQPRHCRVPLRAPRESIRPQTTILVRRPPIQTGFAWRLTVLPFGFLGCG